MRVSRRGWMGLGLASLVASRLGFVSARAADDGKDEKKVDPELKKFEGKWTMPAASGEGTVSYVFKGNKLKIEAPSRSYEMTVTIDSSAKPDKTIDFHIDEGPEDAKGKTSKGIYKFDGDSKLTLCYAPTGDRPTKYEQVGYEQILSTLTRIKEKE